jgi:hypothetical protein
MERRRSGFTCLDIRPAIESHERSLSREIARLGGPTVRISFAPARSPLRNLMPTISAQPAEVADPPNPLPSAGESVLTSAQPRNRLRTPRLGGGLRVG